MFLVLLETSGNQNYIFSTNKLRENIGASELTYRACTQWLLEAVKQEGGPDLWDEDSSNLRANILDPNKNPPLEASQLSVEVIVATSGKGILLVEHKLKAKAIIQAVTRRALLAAPGLDLYGVIQEFCWETDCLWLPYRDIHLGFFEKARSQRPGVDMRFLRLPIVADCKTSGLPAATLRIHPEGGLEPVSRTTLTKFAAARGFHKRISHLVKRVGRTLSHKIQLLEKFFEDELDWLAVIHADGNGLGQIFLNFPLYLDLQHPDQNRFYLDQLRQFSIALEECTEKAFLTALDELPVRDITPLVPLVLGGDDLTVICAGRYAIPFAEAFLTKFEFFTSDHSIHQGIIPQLAHKALHAQRLSACAGVAIIKPHFPFSLAYELTEDLTQSAKKVKQKVQYKAETHSEGQSPFPCSALDYHVLYDSSAITLKEIRSKLKISGLGGASTYLCGRPYVLTPIEQLADADPEAQCWVKNHQWKQLKTRVEALLKLDSESSESKNDQDRRCLPTSQMHDLRSSLFLGQAAADARLNLLWPRYQSRGLQNLDVSIDGSPSLFYTEQGPEDQLQHITHFLDAMDILDFWPTT